MIYYWLIFRTLNGNFNIGGLALLSLQHPYPSPSLPSDLMLQLFASWLVCTSRFLLSFETWFLECQSFVLENLFVLIMAAHPSCFECAFRMQFQFQRRISTNHRVFRHYLKSDWFIQICFSKLFFQRRSKSWSLIDASRLGIELKFDRITLDYLCALSFWRCRVLGNISTRWSRDCAMRRNSAGDLSEEGIAFRLFRLFRLFRHLSNHTSSPSRATEASKFNRCSNNKTKSFIDCNNPMLHQRISSLFNYPIFTTNSKFKFVSIMGRDFNEIM